jgi:hypothetical protein
MSPNFQNKTEGKMSEAPDLAVLQLDRLTVICSA